MILLIDNYDSFTGNLLHLIQMSGRPCRLIRNDECTVDELQTEEYQAIILSPGPKRPSDAGITMEVIRRLHKHTPILGICLGHQAIGEYFGARLVRADKPMHGKTSEIFYSAHPVFAGLPSSFSAMRYHSLVLTDIPDTLQVIGRTASGECMAIAHQHYPLLGLQFHPESILTPLGPKIIENWLRSHHL